MASMRCCQIPKVDLMRITNCRTVAFQPVSVPRPQLMKLANAPRISDSRGSVAVHAGKGGGGGGGKGGGKDSKDTKGGSVGAGGEDVAKLTAKAKTEAEDRMKKCLASVSENYSSIRTGRANPQILDRIVIDYEGVPTPLKAMAGISVPDAFTLLISPFDKDSLKLIDKALNLSDIGLTPNNDGEKIRLILPQLTQDRRKELVKAASKMAEDGKIAIRNVRKDAIKKAEKLTLSKDGGKTLEDDFQKLTDVYIKKLDEGLKLKSDEVMKV